MPTDVQEIRRKVANREPIALMDIHALFEAEGLFMGRQVVLTPAGFVVILRPGQQQQNQQQLMPLQPPSPSIEVTEDALRGINVRGDREVEAQMALMAALRWGEGATVRVRGGRHLRAACEAAGLTVINDNPTAKAWRALTGRTRRRPAAQAPAPVAAPPPQPRPT